MEPTFRAANDCEMPQQACAHEYPRLLADIGGTNARFALEMPGHRFEAVTVLATNSYHSISEALHAYLSQPVAVAAGARQVCHAAFAVAQPVDGDHVKLTNADWAFSIEALRIEFKLDTLLVVNDFTALAMALPRLTAEQKRQVGSGLERGEAPIALLGAGTGLGVSGLMPSPGGWIPLQSEGGHASFAPADEREAGILHFAWREYPHVSAERLMSGMGLELVYRALAHRNGRTPEALSAPDITHRALSGECALCDETIETFCLMLGTMAGNLALTLGAKGGVYIGGGIVPRLGTRFDASGFRRRFEQKGRYSGYLAAIPTFVITAEHPAFAGVSSLLAEKMGRSVLAAQAFR
ncbi:MAG: glucokinase [Burkholderiaceae bacterium]|nr:glucokinase [Burkholderiaceae bacterium]